MFAKRPHSPDPAKRFVHKKHKPLETASRPWTGVLAPGTYAVSPPLEESAPSSPSPPPLSSPLPSGQPRNDTPGPPEMEPAAEHGGTDYPCTRKILDDSIVYTNMGDERAMAVVGNVHIYTRIYPMDECQELTSELTRVLTAVLGAEPTVLVLQMDATVFVAAFSSRKREFAVVERHNRIIVIVTSFDAKTAPVLFE